VEGGTLITVVVPCFRAAPDRLARLYRSLLAQTHRDFEVIVVNDGGRGPQAAPPRDDRFRLLSRPVRCGPSAARNAGAGEARGELLFFTDSDCELAPDSLAVAVAALGEAPLVAGNTLTRASTRFGRLVACLGFPGGGTLGFDRVWRVDPEGFTNSVSGCNFAIRKAVFHEVGGFDATIPVAGGEDTVLGKTAVRQGHRIRYRAEQLVYHAGRESLRSFVGWQVTRGRGSFHIGQRIGGLPGFLRLRLWSLRNSLTAAGMLRAPGVLALFALLLALQALGYELERARARRARRRLPLADLRRAAA